MGPSGYAARVITRTPRSFFTDDKAKERNNMIKTTLAWIAAFGCTAVPSFAATIGYNGNRTPLRQNCCPSIGNTLFL
jgi:hypothetical protein